METGLIKYDEMCRAIVACKQVDEAKDIRDKALALEKYAQVAMNTDNERRACEIRIRAERQCGKLLAKTEKNKGGRPSKNPSSGTTSLADLGISRDQSSKWQRLAQVPDKEFENGLNGEAKPSTTSMITKADGRTDTMHSEALWLWGRLRDLEKMQLDAEFYWSEWTANMQADVRRLTPIALDFFNRLLEVSNERK